MEPGVLNEGMMPAGMSNQPGMFQWGRESQLSTSVPVSVISNAADFQVSKFRWIRFP